MNLVIVESPTKAKTLSRYLGSQYKVEATMGHVRDLPQSKLGINLDKNFEPEYVVSKGKDKVIKNLLSAAQKATNIFLATDPDREGEAIAYHIEELLKKGSKSKKTKTTPSFKRVTFHEITKSAIMEAMEHPGIVNSELVNAQQARRVVDRLVGYTLSPVLWRKIRRGLSAGRVQSVALRLIVEREKEIDAFKAQEYWEIKVLLSTQEKETFWVELVSLNGKKAKKNHFLVPEAQLADSITQLLKTSDYSVTNVAKKERQKSPYPPFTTSTLQQAAGSVLGWSAKQTMSIAQKLYEEGKITYHRTDSLALSTQALESIRGLIQSSYGSEYLPSKPRFYSNKSKNAQEAHEAIRPSEFQTSSLGITKTLTEKHAKLYDLIWKRTVSSQMNNALYDATFIDVEAKKEKEKFGLRANGSILKFDGWRKLYAKDSQDTLLPDLEAGETLEFKDLSSEQKFTQPPARFNDASLVKMLEEKGIGRPSTYAPTISTIIDRGYIERIEKRFHPTAVGKTVVEFLNTNFSSIMDYDFTAEMEEDLDRISRGEKKWVPVVKQFWEPFKSKADEVAGSAQRMAVPVESTGEKCPECEKGEIVIRTGRFGKFYSCSTFPECKYTGKIQEKIENMNCPDCTEGEIVIKKTKRGRTFYGCSLYPKCSWASWTKPTKEEA